MIFFPKTEGSSVRSRLVWRGRAKIGRVFLNLCSIKFGTVCSSQTSKAESKEEGKQTKKTLRQTHIKMNKMSKVNREVGEAAKQIKPIKTPNKNEVNHEKRFDT